MVPSGKRSFGSRSAVLTASRAIASTERVRDGGGGGEGEERRKKPFPGVRWAGGRSRRRVSGRTAARRPARAPSPLVPSPLLSLPPLSRGSLAVSPVPQPLLAPVSLRTVEVFGLCPARLTITFLSLADVRPVPRPVVPSGKRSFGSRSAVLTAKHPPKPI